MRRRFFSRRIAFFIVAVCSIVLACAVVIKNRASIIDEVQASFSSAAAIDKNPDYVRQKDGPLTAGEITSFILKWIHPQTGLVPTEIAKKGTRNPNYNFCSTYATAIAHQVLCMTGQKEESAKMAEAARRLAVKRNLPNTLDLRTGLSVDYFVTAGPNVFWGLSFLREYQVSEDKKWLKAAEQRAELLLSLQAGDGGIRKDPYPGSKEYYTRSVEENLDCYAFFKFLFALTKDKKYQKAYLNILKWLSASGVYNKEEGCFSIAVNNDEIDSTYALDVNTLAVIILGPQVLNATEGDYVFGGGKTAEKLAESFERTRVKISYPHPSRGLIRDVEGFDYTDKYGRPDRGEILSPEFSSQAALAYLVMAKYAKENGHLNQAKKYIALAEDILENLARISERIGGTASLPYATSAGVRRFTFDNWYTPRAEANISSAWSAFPLAGFNPFVKDGFEIADSLKDIAPWLKNFGKIISFPKLLTERPKGKIIPRAKLIAKKEAAREKGERKPVIYYKVLYEKAKEDVESAKKRLEIVMMTGYSCWVGSLIDLGSLDYEVIGTAKDGSIVKRNIVELPEDLQAILKKEYLYYDQETDTQWSVASRYNLDADYSQGIYYAFEVDENYNIVRQFKSEADVPIFNRADLRSIKSQYQSTKALPENHKILRYFLAVEIGKNCKIVKAYENIGDLPPLVSKVPIDKQTYQKYLEADEQERDRLILAGVVPDETGGLAQVEYGKYYYTQILALDTSRRLFVRTYSRESGNEVINGARALLADWEVDEATKINAIKYEDGLVRGMVMEPFRPSLGDKPLLTEPIWIYVGKEVVKNAQKELRRLQRELLVQIEEEKDAQVRQEFIREFDRLKWELAWRDEEGYLHGMYYGLDAAEQRVEELEEVKEEIEASPREYKSVLGCDKEGNDLRDFYGLVWIEVRDKKSLYPLRVETYDMGGHLKSIFSENLEIDRLFKTVTASTKTDIIYNRSTRQMIGSHTYAIDQNGNWLSDICERVFRGYTPDKKHYIMDKRVFLKDKSGRTIFKDGEPEFDTEIEYYAYDDKLAARITDNVITVITYKGEQEEYREVFIDSLDPAFIGSSSNLEDLIKDKVWARRFRPTKRTMSFKDVLIGHLVALPQEKRYAAANAISSKLKSEGAQEAQEVIEAMVLEEREVINNLSGTKVPIHTSNSFVFYKPGDSLGRERIQVYNATIRIPVAWIPGKATAAKTLVFNLSGELISIRETLKPVRADSIFDSSDLKKLAVLNIKPDTLLPKAIDKIYRIKTSPEGVPSYTNYLANVKIHYLIPEDVLGRELITFVYYMLRDEIKLHRGARLEIKKNWLGRDVLWEVWQDKRTGRHRRLIGEREKTVIKEWYGEKMTVKQLQASLMEKALNTALERGAMKTVPAGYEELTRYLREGIIRSTDLLVRPEELKIALQRLQTAPFGVLPGQYVIDENNSLGEIRYFAGLVEYPRDEFSHQGVQVPYEQEILPFQLPAGPPLKGFKYGVLNSKDKNYDVHTLNGQLIVRERPFIQVHLVNMFPIEGAGVQTEYYDPFVPYFYLRPIKIERYFKPGRQPEGEAPGILPVAIFPENATVYHKNGWQTQMFIERRPLDVDHWIMSEHFFNKDGELKYKKEHIENRSLYALKRINWEKTLIFFSGLFFLWWLINLVVHKKMKISRQRKIKQSKAKVVMGVWSNTGIPSSQEYLIERLKAECKGVYENSQPPVKLKELVDKIYRPLIEEGFRRLDADSGNYSAAISSLLARIFIRIGRGGIDLANLYPQEIKEFEDWSAKFGCGFTFSDTALFKNKDRIKDLQEDCILMAILFRIVFDESIEFKASCPGFRFFLFDKCLDMWIKGQENMILQEVQGDVWALLEALRPGYVEEIGLTKQHRFTYEDIEDLFNGKKKGFLTEFDQLRGKSKQKKLHYLTGPASKSAVKDTKDYKSFLWLKTYPDKQGFLRFVINLSRLWIALIPLFVAVLGGGILIGLRSLPVIPWINNAASVLSGMLSPLIILSPSNTILCVQTFIILGLGILATAILFKLTLGGFRFNLKKGLYQSTAKRALRYFWLLFVIAVYVWGSFSIFVMSWTTTVVFKSNFLHVGWELFVDGGALALTLVFIVASFYSFFYVVISIFAYFKGKREGIGQVKNWAGVRRKFEESKKRFMKIMVPQNSEAAPAYAEETWRVFWDAMVEDIHREYKISAKERKQLLYSESDAGLDLHIKLRSKKAQERIQKYINGWLMEMPPADFWTDLPTLTVLITAFNEPVSVLFNELNICDRGATETRLNHLISSYPAEWNEFVDRLTENDLSRKIAKEQLGSLVGLQKIPENLPVWLKEKITRWANIITQPIERTIIGVLKIKQAFRVYARVCYPQARDEEIQRMVEDKIQILLNYEGYHRSFTRSEDRTSLQRLMREFPDLEVYWYGMNDSGLHRYNPRTENIELFQRAPCALPPKNGKPSGVSQTLSFVRGEMILFFDANAAIRIEDALKVPAALTEFNNDPSLAEVLFSEYIYTQDYSWIAQAIGFNDGTFTSVTQRAMDLFQFCGFYGHSAIIKTDVISSSAGIPQDYVSEDILLAIAAWLKGFRTTHKEYLMFGKGRETFFYSSLVPFGKWAVGSSEVGLGRIVLRILRSKQLHYPQKIMLMFGFSFYYHIPLVLFINFLYLLLMVCWGVNAFMTVPFPFMFVILGLMFNQAITSMGVVYLIEQYNLVKALGVYVNLVMKNFLLYTAAIPTYIVGFIKGLKGKIKMEISSKGWNLNHVPFKTIWGKERLHFKALLVTSFIGIPLLFGLVALEVVPFWISPFIAFIPFFVVFIMYGIGVIGSRLGIKPLRALRDEIVPQGDFARVSAVKMQIMFSIGLIAFLGVGFIMWGIIFSSLASKMLFLLSILYISPPLSYLFVPLLAHSQAVGIFKEITLSKLWNYFLVPLVFISCVASIYLMFLRIIPFDAEAVMYLCFGVIFLITWSLLKWRLSGYAFLHKWIKRNMPFYRRYPTVSKLDLQDDIYFKHQEFIRLANDKEKIAPSLRFLKTLLAITILAFSLLYVLSEFERGFYSPWLWLVVAIEIIICFALNIKSTSAERVYLADLIKVIKANDLDGLGNIDHIWQRLSKRYRDNLVGVYNNEVQAKQALKGYLEWGGRQISSYSQR